MKFFSTHYTQSIYINILIHSGSFSSLNSFTHTLDFLAWFPLHSIPILFLLFFLIFSLEIILIRPHKSVTKHHKIHNFMPNARRKRNCNETLRSDKMEIVFRCWMGQWKKNVLFRAVYTLRWYYSHFIRLCARSFDEWTKVTTTTTIKPIKRHASPSTIFFFMKMHTRCVCARCTHSFALSVLVHCAITHTKKNITI